MKNSYDKLDKALNLESNIIESDSKNCEVEIIKPEEQNDIKKDYEYTRANLYSLIEKGQEAINGIMELAGEGGSPRAYEVAATLIKTVSEINKDIIDIHQKMKSMEQTKVVNNNTTNNSIFVGSTSDLQDLINSARSRKKL